MSIRIVFVFIIIIPMITSFQNSEPSEIWGIYVLKEKTSNKENISHKIELQKENICNWHTLTKKNRDKEKCNKKGYFIISDNKIEITWSKNECNNCGTYANWYTKDCPIEILEYRKNELWTTNNTPKRFIKTR